MDAATTSIANDDGSEHSSTKDVNSTTEESTSDSSPPLLLEKEKEEEEEEKSVNVTQESDDSSSTSEGGGFLQQTGSFFQKKGLFLQQRLSTMSRRKRYLMLTVVLAVLLMIVLIIVVTQTLGKSGSRSSSDTNPLIQPIQTTTTAPTLLLSAAPTLLLSTAPTLGPTLSATTSSATPSLGPSNAPSLEPSAVPSFQPSDLVTRSPVAHAVIYPVNPVPPNPPAGYFNYDPNDGLYGPNNWHQVDTSLHWTQEFGKKGWGPWKKFIENFDPTNNICRSRFRQSPIDLVESIECPATHDIRTNCANQLLSSPVAFEKKILPHKLSIIAKRRPCRDDVTKNGIGLGDCAGDRPPMLDYPKYSGEGSDYSDMHHYDIKVPGEHVLDGVEYDAEVQMFHSHLTDGRFSSLAIPIRATADGYNADFQDILNEFQAVYSRHAAQCAANSRRLRGLPALHNVTTTENRKLQRRQGFNPYSFDLMPDHWFYRYDGTITEPPCLPVTWWVMDVPMQISFPQLEQLRRILFSHTDANCQKTSVHNADQSVARPLRRRLDQVQHCKEGSFRPDEVIGRPSGRVCPFI